MKKIVLAAVLAGTGSLAIAGGLDAPIMQAAPEVILEEPSRSSSGAGLIIPLILVALVLVAMQDNNDEEI